MLVGLVLGIALAIILTWLLMRSEPSLLIQLFKIAALTAAILAFVYFILTGRLNLLLLLAAVAAPILIPYFRRQAQEDLKSKDAYFFSSRKISVKEAYAILGLEKGASKKEILEAHRILMKKLHPDHGGNDFLAKQLNEAKDILLKDRDE